MGTSIIGQRAVKKKKKKKKRQQAPNGVAPAESHGTKPRPNNLGTVLTCPERH